MKASNYERIVVQEEQRFHAMETQKGNKLLIVALVTFALVTAIALVLLHG